VLSLADLLISVDSSPVHLAGALGRPVWVMLSFVHDWRWLLERTDSPWYPTARLFRQKSPHDWRGVMDDMAAKLVELKSAW
jgi:ADP-heptose:LPS heptosyltransferase